MKHEDDSDTSGNWCSRNNPQMIGKETGRLGNKRTSRAHPDDSINKIGQNTEKIPGDLRRLPVIQTTVENQRFTLVWKILKGVIIIITSSKL